MILLIPVLLISLTGCGTNEEEYTPSEPPESYEEGEYTPPQEQEVTPEVVEEQLEVIQNVGYILVNHQDEGVLRFEGNTFHMSRMFTQFEGGGADMGTFTVDGANIIFNITNSIGGDAGPTTGTISDGGRTIIVNTQWAGVLTFSLTE